MIGLIVATLVGGAQYLFGDNVAPESAFLTGTNVLFWWYFATSIIGVAIGVLVFFGITGVGTFAGASKWGVGGGFLGAAAGGFVGLFILALIVVTSGMRVAGAYLLHDSVMLTGDVYIWEVPKIVIGGLLVGLPLLISMNSGSSRSHR